MFVSSSSRLVVAFCALAVACSAGSTGGSEGEAPVSVDSNTGGTPPQIGEPDTSIGGQGGAENELQGEVTHPLFGAGSYPNVPPTDPCILAQHWEQSTNMDMTTGALILKDGVVYEVSGVGKGESTWADEWTAPPCVRYDGHCEDLAYRVVTTCD